MIDKLLNKNSVSFPTRRALMVGLVAVMLVLAGCGGGDGGNNTTGGGEGAGTTAASGGGETTMADETTGGGGMGTTMGGPSMSGTMTSASTGPMTSVGPQTTVAGPSTTLTSPPSGTHNDQYYTRLFKTTLNRLNVRVDSLTVKENTVRLKYISNTTSPKKVRLETAKIGGAYKALIGQGWNVQRLDVTVVTPTGETVATWHIESSWARQFNNQQLSTTEYLNRIRSTIETPSNASRTATGTNSTA